MRGLLLAYTVLAALAVSPALAQKRDSLTIGISQFPSTLHPAIDNMSAKNYVLAATHRRLTAFDADWKPVCLLCSEYPTVENGRVKRVTRPDGTEGMTITIAVADGAKWADGTPLTARDIAFSWEVGRHPLNGYFNQAVFTQDVDRVEVVDERTAVLHLPKVRCTFQFLYDFYVLPEHVERPVFEANPAEYRTRNSYETRPLTPGLWTGPYMPTKIERGAYILLERNPHWWGKRPAFDRVTVRTIENTSSLEAALLSGGVDMVPGEIGNLAVEQLESISRRARGRVNVVYKPSLTYEHVDMKLEHPALADVHVRRALLHALDREGMSNELFAGRNPVAHQQISPLDPFYSKDYPRYPHDPARARQLLEEAGWTPGPDGIRRNAKGERLALEFITTGGNRSRELVQVAMQNQWKAVGVEVRIRNQPPRVLFGQTARERSFEGLMMYAWAMSPEPNIRTQLHSEAIPTAENGFAGQNYFGWRNAAVDAAIQQLETVCEAEPRRKVWAEIQRQYAEDLPALPLYYRADGFALPPWLTGVNPTGHQFPTTTWIEHWGVKQ